MSSAQPAWHADVQKQMQAARPKLSSSPCLSPSQRQSHPQHPSSQPTVIKQAARPRPATGSPHMDSRPTRIDPELNRCRPGIALQSAIDLGSTRYRSGLIGIDPGSTHSRRTIRHRPVVIRHRPGGDPRSTVGILTWARPAVDPHSTRCRRSIRDALELDPGSTRGRSEFTRGRFDPRSIRDRLSLDGRSGIGFGSIRTDRGRTGCRRRPGVAPDRPGPFGMNQVDPWSTRSRRPIRDCPGSTDIGTGPTAGSRPVGSTVSRLASASARNRSAARDRPAIDRDRARIDRQSSE